MSVQRGFNWGDEASNAPVDFEKDGIPRDSDTFDPATGIRTLVTYSRNEKGQLVRTTRKLVQKKKTTKISKDALKHRTWKKFGDVASAPPGIEANITKFDNEEVTLTLNGEKPDEISTADMILKNLGKIKQQKEQGETNPKGFLFRQSEKVRQQLSEEAPEVSNAEPEAPAKFVPKFKQVLRAAEASGGRYDDDLPTLRVSNLTEFATDGDLLDLFRSFGPIDRAFLATNRETGLCKGYGFVTFLSKRDAEKAMNALNGHGYDNLILSVEWSKSMREYHKSKAMGAS